MIAGVVSALQDVIAPKRKAPLRLLSSTQIARPPYKRGSSENGEVATLLERRVPRKSQAIDRIAHEANWTANAAFFGNKQHFSMLGNQIVEIPPDDLEVRYLCNKILPHVLRAQMKILGINGRFACRPRDGNTTRDREIARTTMAVWKHIRDVVDYDQEKALAILWAAVCGTSFFRNLFDPAAGDIERYYRAGPDDDTEVSAQLMGEEERRARDNAMLFDDLPRGELDCEAVSAFQVFPDPASKKGLKHCRHICQAQLVPNQVIAEAFGVDEKELHSDGLVHSNVRYEEAIANMTSGFGWSGVNPTTPEYTKSSYLIQCWERPCLDYDKGRYIAYAGGLTLRDTVNPYVGGRTRVCELPFTKLDYITMTGRFWGVSLVELLRSIQFRRNESRARMHEFENVYGQPATFIPKNSEVAPTMMTTRPGALIEYNPVNGVPTIGPKPELPAEVLQNARICDSEMAQIASLSDNDGTKGTGQIRSGPGLEMLFDDRDLALTHTMANVLRCDRDNGRQQIQLAQQFYPPERVAAFRGPNGQWSAIQFTSADLNNDIVTTGEPGEFESTKSERNGILAFVQAGGLNPANPQHAQMIVKAMRYSTTDEIVEDILQHELRQEKEIREIIGLATFQPNTIYPVAKWEDDDAHIRVLVRLFHTDEFERYPDQIKEALGKHYELHEQQRSAKQMAQLQMLALTQSTPASKGVASQPRAG